MKKIIALLIAAICMLTMSLSAVALEASPLPVGNANPIISWPDFEVIDWPVARGVADQTSWYSVKWESENVDGIPAIKFEPKGRGAAHNGYFYFDFYTPTTIDGEPAIDGYYPTVNPSELRYFAVRYMLNEEAASMESVTYRASFFAERSLAKSQHVVHKDLEPEKPAEAGKWVTKVIDMHQFDQWFEETEDGEEILMGDIKTEKALVRFSWWPFGINMDVVPADSACYVHWFGFFATEAEALAYNGEGIEAIEVETEPDTTTKPDTTKPADTTDTDTTKPVESGSASDTAPATAEGGSNIGLYVAIGAVAVVVVAVVIVVVVKKKKK